jgi:nucleoside-diphosphate-sugar epimerase
MKRTQVLITGSEGLIGQAVAHILSQSGFDVIPFDLKIPETSPGHGDVCDPQRLRRALRGANGVIHLAAVSRVIWGEVDPALCRRTNAEATADLVAACLERRRPPWLISASSREVYGAPPTLPATERTPLRPINVYGQTKVAAERAVLDAADHEELRAAVLRFSNVYGRTSDHADRVVPAFCRAASRGEPLRVDGAANIFDFTHVDDVARTIGRVARLLDTGVKGLPPMHLTSGRGCTLWELAELAVRTAGTGAPIRLAPPRRFDVDRFVGDPSLARRLIGWKPTVSLEEGIARLIRQYALSGQALMSHAEVSS